MSEEAAEQQLEDFIARYAPEIAELAHAVLARMRKRLPGALQLVYDNYSYNALAIGFGPTERASEAIFSIALYPRWVSLFFLRGASLPDPEKPLKGSGSQAGRKGAGRARSRPSHGDVSANVTRPSPLPRKTHSNIKGSRTSERVRDAST